MADIIPKEKLAGVQRWHLAAFDGSVTGGAGPGAGSAPAPIIEAEVSPVETQIALPTAEEIEQIYEAARQSGLAAGMTEGMAAAEAQSAQERQDQIAQWRNLLTATTQSLAELEQSVALQTLDLALEVAAQVLRASIKTNPEALLPIVREAITLLPVHHGHIVCQLHPEDAVHLREQLGEQLGQQGIQLVENRDISRGGCQIKAGASEVDATIETRWQRVLDAIGAEPRAWLTD